MIASVETEKHTAKQFLPAEGERAINNSPDKNSVHNCIDDAQLAVIGASDSSVVGTDVNEDGSMNADVKTDEPPAKQPKPEVEFALRNTNDRISCSNSVAGAQPTAPAPDSSLRKRVDVDSLNANAETDEPGAKKFKPELETSAKNTHESDIVFPGDGISQLTGPWRDHCVTSKEDDDRGVNAITETDEIGASKHKLDGITAEEPALDSNSAPNSVGTRPDEESNVLPDSSGVQTTEKNALDSNSIPDSVGTRPEELGELRMEYADSGPPNEWTHSSTPVKKLRRSSKTSDGKSRIGYWSPDEHARFVFYIRKLNATKVAGLPCKEIADYVGTRTSVQVRTHAQKYFQAFTGNKSMYVKMNSDGGDSPDASQDGEYSGSESVSSTTASPSWAAVCSTTSTAKNAKNITYGLRCPQNTLFPGLRLSKRTSKILIPIAVRPSGFLPPNLSEIFQAFSREGTPPNSESTPVAS